MAFKICVKLCVFLYIIICAEKQIFALTDGTYDVRASEFQEISVIDLEHARHRRQTSSDDSTTTTTQRIPTTSPDLNEFNILHDDHSYYESLMFKASNVDDYWVELKDVTGHSTLSDSHRTAVTAKLPFKFPFYGHPIDNVTIATGGFLYMSPFIHKFLTATQYIAPLMANFDTKSGGVDSTVIYKNVGFLYMSPFLHQWLTATQYVAPLMANFDTRIGNSSNVYFSSMDQNQKFVVEWRDVHLQDQNGRSNEGTGSFHFQVILHVNGSITFVYKKLPIPIVNISSNAHPVKIGLSDAFYFDTTTFGTKRRTIYEYHRIALNTTRIEEGTIVIINPQPTCNKFSDCESCVTSKIGFECRWCGIIQKCSDSVDWHRQEWLNAGCVHLSGAGNCSSIPTALPTTEKVPESPGKLGQKRNDNSVPESPGKLGQKRNDNSGVGAQIGVIIVVVVVVVALIGSIGGWIYYAYTHPTSASGMWLMEHRPSQMKAKLSNMKFWKRNGTAGDKYAVESTA